MASSSKTASGLCRSAKETSCVGILLMLIFRQNKSATINLVMTLNNAAG